ncbi:hypothetical protein RHMOL_Rhmol06G0081600 [Rhododendron molle]|uniref:Uncharacterized protein n=1 Tax=Rhododendron molle TaxID=49168 RepID=A0ACC0NBP7_RHOML|nr:hypothetical protein RHMOL_Rhmol06G0081600 [Rhododendron molle]
MGAFLHYKEKVSLAYEFASGFFLDYSKLFNLKEVVQPLIKYVIGNGTTAFLGLDHWHDLGPLYKLFGEDIVSNVGSSLLTKVSSFIQNGSWH